MSQTSLGMGSGIDDAYGSIIDNENLSPEGGSPPGESTYDCIAYIIYCGDHEKIALTRALKDNQLRAVWLPFVALSSIGNWQSKAEEGVQLILRKEDPELEAKMGREIRVPVSKPKRLQLHRTQIPVICKFVTRLICFVRLGKSQDFRCCENTKRIQWFSLNDAINSKIDKVWGLEVKQFASLCKRPKSQGISEFTLNNAFIYVADRDRGPQTTEEDLIRVMHIGKREIEVLFADYLDHCFPSVQMSIHSFKDYLYKYGFNCEDRRFAMLFNAFDFNGNGYLEFQQLLIGLVLMDKNAPHKQHRTGFVFRYYDYDCDGFLNLPELKSLIRDLFPNEEPEAINQKAIEWLQSMNSASKYKCSYEEFATGVGSLKLRGTSSLCRLEKSILNSITKSVSSRELQQKSVPKLKDKLKDKTKDVGPCFGCRIKKYDHALHRVLLNTTGRCVEIRIEPREEDTEMNCSRIYSKNFTFESESFALSIMDMIQEFHLKKNRNKEKGFATQALEKESFIRNLQHFCTNLEHIFSSEQRVVRINGPTYVIGDIYGNLNDVMAMESILWPSFPIISVNCVFLGNYVDYGKWGVECIVYLLCLKLIAPNKVFLLRGRHEIRDIQIQNTFLKECVEKYDEIIGKRIWQMFNNLFDRMPFALIVDETIFCTHSGIPNTKTKVQDLNKINFILKNPSVDSPVVWQLLTSELTDQPLKKTGLDENQGNGSPIFFNEVTVNTFLEVNGFTRIICANRLSPNGYEFRFGSKFINVFSTSDFKNSNNKSAVLLLQNHKIRAIPLVIPKEDMKTTSDLKSIAEPNKSSTNSV